MARVASTSGIADPPIGGGCEPGFVDRALGSGFASRPSMATTTLCGVTFDTARTDLRPLPIEPAWIKDGTPVARSLTLSRSPDSLLTAGLWDCTAGQFIWIFRRDEIVHVLEGEVRVHDGDVTHVLVPGCVAYFPHGLETVWEVPTYVKKAFVLRAAPPTPLRRAAAAVKARLASLVRGRNSSIQKPDATHADVC
jgi:uncharacterized protein